MSKVRKIAILSGDGIGPEIINEAVKVLKQVEKLFGYTFECTNGLIGGAALDRSEKALPDNTLRLCKQSDAILLGAVGGDKWDSNERELRPETGLLQIRKELDLYTNLRPAIAYNELLENSPLKNEIVQNVSMMIIRELTGGLYFGEKKRQQTVKGKVSIDTLVYYEYEIKRIARNAFEIARTRRKHVTSVDKENILETSRLWREVFNNVSREYPDVILEHMLVDNCAMQLVQNPQRFDVIVSENSFADILSDEAAIISGSIGMLPSASIGEGSKGLYEPAHGSAPDIAGKGIANPTAAILSVAMMMRYSFNDEVVANAIEEAVDQVLKNNYRTRDLAGANQIVLSTEEYGDKVVQYLN